MFTPQDHEGVCMGDGMIVTLIGIKQAKVGFSFVHEGSLKECTGCKLFEVCMKNLDQGRVYRITGVRDKLFSCKVHDEGVRVVEVVEPSIEGTLESRLIFPAGIITFQPQECDETSCEYYPKCFPKGLTKGDRCKIVSVSDRIKCPLNRPLVFVTLQRLTDQKTSS